DFPAPLAAGVYQLIARQTIQSLDGESLDGDADGTPGGDFKFNFNVAALEPAGGETKVNTYTTNSQRSQSIGIDAAGDYVVAWQSSGQDGSGEGIFAQAYNSAGVPQGIEFQVNTYTTGDQASPSVAMDAAGNYIITWQSDGQDSSGYGIFAQRFNSAGVPQGT